MQGRIDVIDLLLKKDSDGAMQKELDAETKKSPPSLVRVLSLHVLGIYICPKFDCYGTC